MYEFLDDDMREPDECEMLVFELKDKLRESVRKEFIDEIDRLRKENAELQDVKARWDEVKAELDAAKFEYKSKLRTLELKVRNERISDLLKSVSDKYYIVAMSNRTQVLGKKCDMCNDDRYRVFYSPRGVMHKETCVCKTGHFEYHVAEGQMCKIVLSSIYNKPAVTVKFSIDFDGGESSMTVIENSDDKPFDQIDDWKAAFISEEKAKEYAAWRTQQSYQKNLECGQE